MTWEQRRAQILATIKSKKGLKTGILKKSLDEDRSTNVSIHAPVMDAKPRK